MHKKENRRFADDSWDVAVARTIFIKWMKSRGLWAGYLRHLGEHPSYMKKAWLSPTFMVDFLGECSYEYEKAFVPWDNYCTTLQDHIKFEQNEYTKDRQGS